MTSIKFFWLKAGNAARHERSLVKLIWAADRQLFQYSRPGLQSVNIQLATLRMSVHDNISELYRCFKQLLPSTFPLSRIAVLPWDQLRVNRPKTNALVYGCK